MARTKGTTRSSRTLRPLRNARKGATRPPPPPLPQPPAQSTRILRSHTAAQQAAQQAATKPSKPAKRRLRQDPWAPKRKVNPNPKPRPPPPSHFTCRICLEEQPTSQFPRWVPPRRGRYNMPWDVPFPCIAHLARNPQNKKKDPVCNTCIGNIMSARLDMVGARKVTGCVDPACPNDWSWEFIMRYMPKDAALEKFNLEMLEVWKQDLTAKLVECISPTCNAIGLPEPSAPGYPQVSCNECGIRTCAQCLVPWHADVTCAEYAAKDINEKMSDPEKDTLKFMQTKDGKRCPNCFLVIEKDGGCDSMYCLGCFKYFNWATAASAVPGTTKAQPFILGQPYWQQHDASVMCEVDALNAKEHGGAPLMRLIPEVS